MTENTPANAATAKATPAKTPEATVSEPVKKFRMYVRSLPATTPDEQVMFGYGGIKLTAGDLRKVLEALPQ